MKPITTVDELIATLKGKDNPISYYEMMKHIKIPIREFEKYYSWKKEGMTRNRIISTKNFELLLICFEKDQQTSIHSYQSTQLWVQTIQGQLTEQRFKLSRNESIIEQSGSSIIPASKHSMIPQREIHQFSNKKNNRAVLLILSNQPIKNWIQYELNGVSKTVSAKYDSIYV